MVHYFDSFIYCFLFDVRECDINLGYWRNDRYLLNNSVDFVRIYQVLCTNICVQYMLNIWNVLVPASPKKGLPVSIKSVDRFPGVFRDDICR